MVKEKLVNVTFVLQLLLFVLFLKFFGLPLIHKYEDGQVHSTPLTSLYCSRADLSLEVEQPVSLEFWQFTNFAPPEALYPIVC